MLYMGTQCASPPDTLQAGRGQKSEGAAVPPTLPGLMEQIGYRAPYSRELGGGFCFLLLNHTLEKLCAIL